MNERADALARTGDCRNPQQRRRVLMRDPNSLARARLRIYCQMRPMIHLPCLCDSRRDGVAVSPWPIVEFLRKPDIASFTPSVSGFSLAHCCCCSARLVARGAARGARRSDAACTSEIAGERIRLRAQFATSLRQAGNGMAQLRAKAMRRSAGIKRPKSTGCRPTSTKRKRDRGAARPTKRRRKRHPAALLKLVAYLMSGPSAAGQRPQRCSRCHGWTRGRRSGSGTRALTATAPPSPPIGSEAASRGVALYEKPPAPRSRVARPIDLHSA